MYMYLDISPQTLSSPPLTVLFKSTISI
jgi:hypothetical protein